MEERDDYYNMHVMYDDAFDIMCKILQKWGLEYTPYPDYNSAKVHNILEYDAEKIVRRVSEIYWSTRRKVTVNGAMMPIIIPKESYELRDYKFQFGNEEDFKAFSRILIDEKLWFNQSIKCDCYNSILVYLLPDSTAKRLYDSIKEKGLILLN